MGKLCRFALIFAVALSILVPSRTFAAAGGPRLAPRDGREGRALTVEERVAYQRAVEEVYWRHKIWPAENAGPKQPLDEVMPPSAVRARVEDALRASAALEAEFGRPITPEQLQAEVLRMAADTRQPDLLRELWAALDNDPYVVAECLARPALAERLLRNWYAYDARRHGGVRARAEAALAGVSVPDDLRRAGGDYVEVEWARRDGAPIADEDKALRLTDEEWDAGLEELARSFAGPASKTGEVVVGRVGHLRESETRFSALAVIEKTPDRMRIATVSWQKRPFDEWWSAAKAGFAPASPPPAVYQALAAPSGACASDSWKPTASQMTEREWHTVVWTGTEMIVWGGTPFTNPENYNPAGRYNPATDTWTITSAVNAPTHREKHTAVWTGTEMIVWGGNFDVDSGPGTGARYNPQTDTWTATSTAGAPAARQHHTAVWTGSRMLVWGGQSDQQGLTAYNTGASYDPATNSWTPITTSGAPTGRRWHAAVWTGSEMVVWGGVGGGDAAPTNTGARYNPSTNAWTATPTAGAPSARYAPTAVWTGTEMIVWGGSPVVAGASRLNTGARYNPSTNSWTATSTTNAPEGAALARAVWTGTEMIVWGGEEPTIASTVRTGGRYNPASDSWVPVTPTRNSGVRTEHPAVWTGTEMIVWGSYEELTIPTNTGARYFPSTDTWLPTSMTGVPIDRYAPLAVWTGTEMIVWGGCDDPFCFTRLNSGGRYNPQTDAWRPVNMQGAPEPRYWFSAVWTGTEMLVWGGCNAQTCGPGGNSDRDGIQTGGRYNPATDSWQPMPVTAATPTGRWFHSSTWTGSQMLVWGGEDGLVGSLGTGARYDPAANAWQSMATAGAPSARAYASMVWTGSEALVWGGHNGQNDDQYTIVTGGRYDPATNAWRPTSTANAPLGRSGQTAVWTGREMIVWGGCRDFNCQTPLQTGGRYDPSADTWTPTSTLGAPPPRDAHSAVWTGTEMIVFGGEWGARNPTVFDSGGRYCLASPYFDLACSPASLSAAPGAQSAATGTVTSANGFAGSVALSTSGLPAGVTAAFSPQSVSPQPGGSAASTLTLSVGAATAPGTYSVAVTATSGGLTRTQSVDLTVSSAAARGDAVALYRADSGVFFLRYANAPGGADATFGYGPGGASLVPLAGDWNGDGADSVGLYDPSTSTFFLRNSNASGPADVVFSFGAGGAGLVPVTGDWNGDGVDTVGIYQPATGVFFLRNQNSGGAADAVFAFGAGGAGILPLAGDWNGDGTDTVGLYATGSGAFFLRNQNSGGAADVVFSFGPGAASWRPLAGDWNGDGRTTVGLYSPDDGAFFLTNANASGTADVVFTFGAPGAGSTPLVGAWAGR
jgi:N-acetylneuraminic acid mutarotase